MKIEENIIITKIPLNVKNRNGRIYTKECFERWDIDEEGNRYDVIQSNITNDILLGEFGHSSRFETSLLSVTHKVTSLKYIEDGNSSYMLVKGKFLNTDRGNEIKYHRNKIGDDMVLSPRGVGNLREDGTLENYKLFTFDLILESDSAFSNIHFSDYE